MIFKIFSPKILAKKLAFFAQSKAKLCKNWIITLVFEKNANFFAENWQKSQKSVIITSTPDWANLRLFGNCLLWAVLKMTEVNQTFVVIFNMVKLMH
jgi:hypothetical protein